MTTHREPLASVLDTVGNTPLVRLQRAPESVPIYAKLESFNPGGSVKDRIGKHILEGLRERGDLEAGDTVIEPTAGNTGIGMAITAGQLDLSAIFVVPTGFSEEKEVLMEALGAEIVNTPGEDGMPGAVEKAHELAGARDDAVVPQQFSNPLNVDAHVRTTGPEILDALGAEIGALVAGIGSAGTLIGTARALRERVPEVYVAGVEPEGSMYGSLLSRRREAAPYKTEGIGSHRPGVAELLDPGELDDIIAIGDREIQDEVKRLAREEGHLAGSSSGAASLAAYEIARQIDDGDIAAPADSVVTIFPDSSERYLSKHIYGSFAEWEGKG